MPTGKVRLATRGHSVSARRNSSQALTKARMPAVKTPGAVSGTTTRQRAPSRRAAVDEGGVLEVGGMSWKKATSTRVQTGIDRTA